MICTQKPKNVGTRSSCILGDVLVTMACQSYFGHNPKPQKKISSNRAVVLVCMNLHAPYRFQVMCDKEEKLGKNKVRKEERKKGKKEGRKEDEQNRHFHVFLNLRVVGETNGVNLAIE